MPSPLGNPTSAHVARLILLAGWLACLPLLAKNEEAPEAEAPRPVAQRQSSPAPAAAESRRAVGENRFLVIVDTSSGMSRADKNLRQTLFALVHSGIRGCMQPGDTYGIWFFNSQTHTDYPMQVWNPAQNSALAAHARDYLAQLGYKHRPKVDVLVRDLHAVISSVADVNVILLSDGSTPIEGTPFDTPINALFKAHQRDFRVAREVFVISLAARAGKLVSWSVNRSEDALRFARVNPPATHPPRAAPIAKPQSIEQVLAEPPREPAPSAVSRPVTQAPEPPVTIASNPETEADASARIQAAPVPPTPSPLATLETAPQVPTEPSAPPDPITGPSPPVAELSKDPAQAPEPLTASAIPPAHIPVSLAESVLADALVETHSEALQPAAATAPPSADVAEQGITILDPAAVIRVAAREPDAATDPSTKTSAPGPKPAAGMTASAAGGTSAKTLFLLGLAFLAAGVVVLGLYVRLFHSGSSPSLISRSMQRK